MLLGQYLCWRHDACLIAIVQCDEHRHECHKGLSTAHITLQQPVHLPSGAHVLTDFADDTLLGICQLEGQVVVIEAVEDIANSREYVATEFASLVAGIPQNVQLDVEQFFELQSQTGLFQLLGIQRIVNLAQSLIARHEVELLGDEVGQRFWDTDFQRFEQRLGQSFNRTAVQSHFLHLLRGVVVRLHAHRREFQFFCQVDVGMGYVDASVIDVGASEDDIVPADGIVLLGIFATIEPRQVHDLAATIRKMRHHALLTGTHLEGLETQNLSFYLHKGHVAR